MYETRRGSGVDAQYFVLVLYNKNNTNTKIIKTIMNTSGQQSQQQQQQQKQGGGYHIHRNTRSPSKLPSAAKSHKRPLNPLQNQAQLQKIMSLFQ